MPPSPAGASSWARPPRRLGPSAWVLPHPGSDATDLVGLGADLAPETLVDAYRRGIFPWPHDRGPLPWFSPDPRAVILLLGRPACPGDHRAGPGAPRAEEAVTGPHLSQSLGASLRRSGWETTVDTGFEAVVAACADRAGDEGTWITPEMAAAYARLHRLGWAHSLEVWDGCELVGGIYGVRVGGCFTGESMFHRRTDASKAALVDLCRRWQEAGGAFVDVQLPTAHLTSMGAVEVSRARFLAMLAGVVDATVHVRTDRLPVSRLAP